jgi:Ca-activated chloride channel homolog
MKRRWENVSGVRCLLVAWLVCLGMTVGWAGIPGEMAGDRTLSPYFFVKSDDPAVDQLPLKATSANVAIAGVIADVTVTQEYQNLGKRPIEAVYVFPAGTKAAVYGMKMTIGDRTIVATIKRKEEARRDYELARQQGRSASLLEQQRPNVFTMNVANILPGDVIKVELRYTELLVPTEGVYEFVYPTVVGPRYTSGAEAGQPEPPTWNKNPYLHEGQESKTTFDLKLALDAGMDIHEASCESHKHALDWQAKSGLKLALDASEKYGGNRDFIFRYRLAGGQIQSGLLLSRGDDENFFLLMVQPPERVKPEEMPAREYVFIVDVSGSMHGYPLDTAKKMMRELFDKMRPQDVFNVMLFSGSSRVLHEKSVPATPENIATSEEMLGRQSGGGSTELVPALRKALSLPAAAGTSRSFVILTDGYVSVEHEAFELVRQNLGQANVFAFGIGSSINRFLIEGLARAGMGEPFFVTKPAEADAIARKFRQYIESPVLTNVSIDYGEFVAKSVEPPSVPDVLADRPVIVFGKWQGAPGGTIRVTGTSGSGPFIKEFPVGNVTPRPENNALRYLWARHRIAVLSDFNQLRHDKELVEEVTRLGLQYGLLTAHTSFVAVDSLIRTDQVGTQVKQPLPLPQGVSDLAIGSSVDSEMAFSNEYRKESRGIMPMALAPRPVGPPMPPPPPPPPAKISRSDRARTDDRLESDPKSKDAPKAGTISIAGLIAGGGLSSAQIREALATSLEALQKHYAVALGKTVGLRGEIGVEMVIGADGRVESVKIFNDGLNHPDLAKQVIAELKKATFSKDPARPKREITLTLTFS